MCVLGVNMVDYLEADLISLLLKWLMGGCCTETYSTSCQVVLILDLKTNTVLLSNYERAARETGEAQTEVVGRLWTLDTSKTQSKSETLTFGIE